jgi:hypothetical protein
MTPIPTVLTGRLSEAVRIAVAVVVTVAALLVIAPPAHACSCVPPPPVAEVLETAPLAFVGTQVGRAEAQPTGVVLTISVAEVYVGEATTLIDLHTGSGDADCEIDLAGLGPVGFTPSMSDGGLYVGLCGGTVPADEMRQVFAERNVPATGPVSSPDAAPPDDAAPDETSPDVTSAPEPLPTDQPVADPADTGGDTADAAADRADPETGPSSLIWLLAVLAGAGVVGAGYLMARRRR